MIYIIFFTNTFSFTAMDLQLKEVLLHVKRSHTPSGGWKIELQIMRTAASADIQRSHCI